MSTTVRCAYCSWVGQEPSPAEYPDMASYEEAYREYEASHDDDACDDERARRE